MNEIFQNIVILQKTTKPWEEKVFDAIPSLDKFSSAPLKKILSAADERCETIVVEDEYVDEDYIDSYSNYYSMLFADYRSKCVRLHFFSTKITYDDLVDLSIHQPNYFGFCILRPTLSFQVSRTILRPFHNESGSCFTLCQAQFEVNLSGNKLRVSGAPYIQQDTNVNVCAQASIWMSCLYMHNKFATPRLLPSQINELIEKCFSLGSVREGLNPLQVVIALREIGFEPHYFPRWSKDGDPASIAKLIYGYAESEMPVILALQTPRGGHAVTVVGHDFNVRDSFDHSCDSNLNWIDNFYINDDAQGPYLKIGINNKGSGPGDSGYSVKDNVVGAIIPTPKEIKMRLDDVYMHIKVLMSGPDLLNEVLRVFKGIKADMMFQTDDFKDLIFRTFLVKSNDFKVSLPNSQDYSAMRMLYRSTRMPKYIWLSEISTPDLINNTDSGQRKRLGEVILDSTADRHSYLTSYLAIHFKGRLVLKKAGTDRPFHFFFDPNEQPCPHLVRDVECCSVQ